MRASERIKYDGDDYFHVLTDDDFRQKFREGIDCSAQVLAEVADDIFITEEEAYRMASCFGAGMLVGGTCGAITGCLLAIGIKHGNYELNDFEQKGIVNSKRIEFVTRFKEIYGGRTTCTELLGVDLMDPDKRKVAREDGTIDKKCPYLIRTGLEILKDVL